MFHANVDKDEEHHNCLTLDRSYIRVSGLVTLMTDQSAWSGRSDGSTHRDHDGSGDTLDSRERRLNDGHEALSCQLWPDQLRLALRGQSG